jgi:hypothetical protein
MNIAKNCFEENLKLFADARSQPEKYNLYTGLYNLAKELETITHRLDNLEHMIKQIPTDR